MTFPRLYVQGVDKSILIVSLVAVFPTEFSGKSFHHIVKAFIRLRYTGSRYILKTAGGYAAKSCFIIKCS